MKNFILIKLKYNLFSYKNLILYLVLVTIISFFSIHISNEEMAEDFLYTVAIVDYDESALSSSFIKELKTSPSIETIVLEDIEGAIQRLTRGNYDVVYEINEGFEEEILAGNFEDIITLHKEIDSLAVAWINDQISIRIVREWIFQDMLLRLNKLDADFDVEALRQEFEKRQEENTLVRINEIIVAGRGTIEEQNINANSKYSFKLMWGVFILYSLMGIGKNMITEKEKGIIKRLGLSNMTVFKYQLNYFVIGLVNVLIPFVISSMIVLNYDIFNLEETAFLIIATILYSIITWFTVMLLIKLTKTKRTYILASQLFLISNILLGSGIIYNLFIVLDILSWAMPLRWYVQNVIQ
ncbi:MAG: ABC transporter permease [Clostridiales bacterium]|nr:ABC transporter permease [Clostridiales bacterium]